MKYLVVLLPIFLAACCDELSRRDLGIIQRVEYPQTSFNECARTVIVTDKTSIAVCTAVKVIPLNQRIEMILDSCGRKGFQIENGPTIGRR